MRQTPHLRRTAVYLTSFRSCCALTARAKKTMQSGLVYPLAAASLLTRFARTATRRFLTATGSHASAQQRSILLLTFLRLPRYGSVFVIFFPLFHQRFTACATTRGLLTGFVNNNGSVCHGLSFLLYAPLTSSLSFMASFFLFSSYIYMVPLLAVSCGSLLRSSAATWFALAVFLPHRALPALFALSCCCAAQHRV